MALAQSTGARIYYEETGSGVPIIFVHEFAGDYRTWDDQMRHFGRGWHAVTMSARGYPKSDAPDDEALYGQAFFNRDIVAVMDATGIKKAHIVGLSMGAYAALMVAIEHPDRVLSVIAAGGGSGSPLATRQNFQTECRATAAHFDKTGKIDASAMGHGPTRIQLKNKDPIGWQRFVNQLAEHPAHAAAMTLRQVQALRPSLYELEAKLKAIACPVLLMVGDEDEPCLDVNLWMKRLMPVADLVLLPASGHAVNLEEPLLFNLLVEQFLNKVDGGRWHPRDPSAKPGAVLTSLSAAAAIPAEPDRKKRQ
jgi:pimeloyl-ACP methyl ester carboxylesterase